MSWNEPLIPVPGNKPPLAVPGSIAATKTTSNRLTNHDDVSHTITFSLLCFNGETARPGKFETVIIFIFESMAGRDLLASVLLNAIIVPK